MYPGRRGDEDSAHHDDYQLRDDECKIILFDSKLHCYAIFLCSLDVDNLIRQLTR